MGTNQLHTVYYVLDNFKICNKYENIFTKNYSGLIVFETVTRNIALPDFYIDIYKNKKIDFSLLNNFTIFFLKNFCTKAIEKLLKPLVLFKEVPEVIISKYWVRVYTHESPFYSIMNKFLMNNIYKEYEVYIKLLYRGLACNSYKPIYDSTLSRGTKLELDEIEYLKSIAGKNITVFNKSFLSFSLNLQLSIKFQENETRDNVTEVKEDYNTKQLKKDSLNVLIKINNISEHDKEDYVISNAYLKNISYYSKEEEVLIFPFTGFEVISWKKEIFEKKDYYEESTVFEFRFSRNFLQKIKRKYEN